MVSDRYQVVEPIAHGGQGVVVRVRDTDLGRELALKTIHADPTGEGQARARLEAEARVLASLEHPGVPPVHERGSLPDGRPFFTMRLVRGRTLAELVAESSANGRLEPDRPGYLRLFEQICRTVAYAHLRGIIHRDLKPSNVMVGAFGEVQVMDWGLALPLDVGPVGDGAMPGRAEPDASPCLPDEPGMTLAAGVPTLPGEVVGTAAYMPVEQARGWSDRHGPASDVFGLGGILCVLLTGCPPYAAHDPRESLARAVRGDLGDTLARLDSCGADPALVRLARACLAVNPEDRIPNAHTVAELLGEYLAQIERRLRDAEVRRAEAEARAGGERRRRRLTLALAGMLVLATTLGFGLWDLRKRQEGVLERAHSGAAALRDRAGRSGATFPSGASSAARCVILPSSSNAGRVAPRPPDAPPISSTASGWTTPRRSDSNGSSSTRDGSERATSMIAASQPNTSASSGSTGSTSARPPRRAPRVDSGMGRS